MIRARFASLACLLLLGTVSLAQSDDPLARPWFKNASWRTDFDAARAESKKTGKLVFAYFTRPH